MYTTIKELCLKQTSHNPIEISQYIMNQKDVPIHGPIHHMIDGASLLTAYYNQTQSFDLSDALDEMIERSKKMPGATCGQWGVCGACSSIGAALSIIHQSGPLSDDQYYKDHMKLTSMILAQMSEIGGPRCCKRNASISLLTAIKFIEENYQIKLETSSIHCSFSSENKQCIKERCPFYQL